MRTRFRSVAVMIAVTAFAVTAAHTVAAGLTGHTKVIY